MASKAPVMAIDGPGGAGKGTVAQRVAEQLGWHLLDSGALYRLIALEADDAGIDPGDEVAIAQVAAGLDAQFLTDGGQVTVLLAGQPAGERIRTEACGRLASQVAAMPAVRRALVERQRAFRRPPGLVADGRDMGSVIFPDAGLKIFLTASVEERARRRYKQLKEKGIDVTFPALLRDMADRDRRDAERAVAPLQACRDARILDTTDLGIDDVVSCVLSWAAETYP